MPIEEARYSRARQSSQSIDYVYIVFYEEGGPQFDTDSGIKDVFSNLPEANKEAKAIARDSDFWENFKDDEHRDCGIRDTEIGRPPYMDSGIDEWKTSNGELRIAMQDDEGDYYIITVARHRLQHTSSYVIDPTRRAESEAESSSDHTE